MSVATHDVDEEVFGKAYDGRLVRRLVGYLRPYTKSVALAMGSCKTNEPE